MILTEQQEQAMRMIKKFIGDKDSQVSVSYTHLTLPTTSRV